MVIVWLLLRHSQTADAIFLWVLLHIELGRLKAIETTYKAVTISLTKTYLPIWQNGLFVLVNVAESGLAKVPITNQASTDTGLWV